jgi:hypothetical protein
MTNTKYIQSFFISVIFLITSCVTNKPRFSDISLPDNNARQSVENPYFIKKTNPLGYLSTVGLAGGGAATGYFFPFIGVNKNEGITDKSKIYSAVTAGVIGAGVGFLTNTIIFGHGKKVDINENKKKRTFDFWTKGYNKKYRKKQIKLIAYKNNHYTLIPENGYKQFVFYNIDDVNGYLATFPEKPNLKNILDRSVENLNRNECKQVVDLFGEEYRVNKYRIRYISLSESYNDLVEANTLYPNLVENIDELAANKIQNASNALDFINRFPNTEYLDVAALNSYTTYSYPSEQKEMNSKYGSLFNNISPIYLNSKASDIQKENYFKTQLDSKNITELGQLAAAIDNIKWINFTNRSNIILERHFEIADKQYNDGDYIVYLLRKTKDYSWNILNVEIDNYIQNIYKQQLEKVYFSETEFRQTDNPDLQKWLKADYTAGIVKTEGELYALQTGKVTNTSKYSLPIVVKTKGEIREKVTGSIKIFGKNLTGNVVNRKLGEDEVSYYINSIKPNETNAFANLFDLGNVTQMGINAWDWVKALDKILVENISNTIEIFNGKIENLPSNEIENQKYAIKLSKTGLPSASLWDIWNEENVDDNTWKKRYEIKLEEERKWREEYARRMTDLNNRIQLVSKNDKLKDAVFKYDEVDGLPNFISSIHICMNNYKKKNGSYDAENFNACVSFTNHGQNQLKCNSNDVDCGYSEFFNIHFEENSSPLKLTVSFENNKGENVNAIININKGGGTYWITLVAK